MYIPGSAVKELKLEKGDDVKIRLTKMRSEVVDSRSCLNKGKRYSNESCKDFIAKYSLAKYYIICKNCKSWTVKSKIIQSRLGEYLLIQSRLGEYL